MVERLGYLVPVGFRHHQDMGARAKTGIAIDLRQLEADGLADSTIVIWTSDHGDGLPRAKRELYDAGTKSADDHPLARGLQARGRQARYRG